MNPEQLLTYFDRVSEAPDAIPRLRRLMLDLALRGKLVEQEPADEPVEELLTRVEVEKQRLIKGGKIRGRKRFQISKKVDPPFGLPPSWCWVQLREISTLITKGSTPTSYGHSFVPSGINFIKVEGIKDGKVALNTVTSHISIETHEFLKRSRLEEGDFLFSIAGSIGTCAVVTKAILPANTNQALAIIRGTNFAFLPRFLQYSTSSSLLKSAVEKARGGAMNNISLEDVGNFALPLPPLAEQHRIVAKVDELMVLCDQLEAAREERERRRGRLTAASLNRIGKPTEEENAFREHARFHLANLSKFTHRPDQISTLRNTILELAIRGKLVPQDPNDEPAKYLLERIDDEKGRRMREGSLRISKPVSVVAEDEETIQLPSGWLWVRMGQVIKLWSGFAFKSEDFQPEGIPVIRIGDLQAGFVDIAKAVCVSQDVARTVGPDVWIPENALLIAMSGATTGKVAFNKTGVRLLLNQRVGRIEVFIMSTEYVRFFFETIVAKNLNISFGTAIPNLSAEQINTTVFPMPPLAEQHRIVAKVDELMLLCDRLEAQLSKTKTESRRLLDVLLHLALEPALADVSA